MGTFKSFLKLGHVLHCVFVCDNKNMKETVAANMNLLISLLKNQLFAGNSPDFENNLNYF